MAEAALHYWDAYWDLREKECPCDVHFLEYLERHGIGGKVIFHFGTGAHHVVGTTCARAKPPNEVLGVTATVEEYQRYMEIVIAEPLYAIALRITSAKPYGAR